VAAQFGGTICEPCVQFSAAPDVAVGGVDRRRAYRGASPRQRELKQTDHPAGGLGRVKRQEPRRSERLHTCGDLMPALYSLPAWMHETVVLLVRGHTPTEQRLRSYRPARIILGAQPRWKIRQGSSKCCGHEVGGSGEETRAAVTPSNIGFALHEKTAFCLLPLAAGVVAAHAASPSSLQDDRQVLSWWTTIRCPGQYRSPLSNRFRPYAEQTGIRPPSATMNI